MANAIDITLYRNRWIAIVHDRVIGVGTTREQAYRAAKRIRPKDTPQLLFITVEGETKSDEMRQPTSFEQQFAQYPLLQQTVNTLQQLNIEAYLVGGPVRDLLLERKKIDDFDFTVPENGLDTARKVAGTLNAAFYPLDIERGTGRVVCQVDGGIDKSRQIYLDFATFRGPTLQADLADRDFTINAIALSLNDTPHLIDPLGGQDDLKACKIRAASTTSFQHDPVRVLRAVRQAIQFNFSIEPLTQQYLTEAAPALKSVSPERQRDELLKLLNTPEPGQAIKLLSTYNVLPHILPEIEALIGVNQSEPHYLDVFEHTVKALNGWAEATRRNWSDFAGQLPIDDLNQELNASLVGNITQQELLPMAVLLHDVGKPLAQTEEAHENQIKYRFLGHENHSAKITRRVMNRLRFSRQANDFVVTVVKNHMRPLNLAVQQKTSRRAIFRFFRDTTGSSYKAGIATTLHAWIDHQATYPPNTGRLEAQALRNVITSLVTAYFEQKDEIVDPVPLLTGRDLKETFNLPQGKLIGILLNRLKEAQATGQVTDKPAALAFIRDDPDFANYQKSEL